MAKKYYVFIVFCVIIGLTGGFLYSQSPEKKEEKKFSWKILSVYAPRLSIYQNGLKKFATDIKVLSNGQLEITIYNAGEEYKTADGQNKNIKAEDVFNDVSEGKVEMGFGSSSIFTGKIISESDFWYSVPFGLNAKDMYAWLYRGGGLDLWREKYLQYNVIPFPVGDTGGSMGGWFKDKIKNKSKFGDMNIRMAGLHAKVMQKLGANPKWMPSIDALNDYNIGDIDAIVCLGPYADQGYNLFKGPKNYYYPGWQEPCGVISLIINKEAWDGLPENLKRTIEIVCGSTYQYIYNQFDSMNSVALKELQEKEGVTLLEFPPEILNEFRRLSSEVLEEEAENNQDFKQIYEAFKKFKKENLESKWSKIVNSAFYSGTTTSFSTTASKFIEGLADSKLAKTRQEGNNSVVIILSGKDAFGSWQSALNPALTSEVVRIAKIIRENAISIKWIKVEGHAATDGDEYPNWQVSKARAYAVSELLIDNGIDQSFIKVVPHGESDPIIPDDNTEEKRSINRRVEIVIEF